MTVRLRFLTFLLAAILPGIARADTDTSSTASDPTGPTPPAAPLTDLLAAVHPLFGLEYRMEGIALSPLSLNDDSASDVTYLQQRARLKLDTKIQDRVRVILLADLLDGVLFGDNGSFTGSPKKNRGSVAASRSPNLARIGVDRVSTDGSSVDRSQYGLVLEPAEAVQLRLAYGEALLPFGLLRAGRQPLGTGRSVLVSSGERINRWGVSRGVDSVDGAAFGTKLSAIADAIAGKAVDADPTRGVFLGLLGGQVVEGLPQHADDLFQLAGTVFTEQRGLSLLGLDLSRLRAGLIASYRKGDQFETSLTALTGYIELESGPFRAVFHHAQMIGSTREVAEGLSGFGAAVGGSAIQPIRAYGGFGELAYRLARSLELSFEVYYASGDEDPRSTTPIEQLTFSENTNVGLHLFENVIAYETARSARMGVTNLASVRPPTQPAAEVDTRGGLQNAIVLFPQVLAAPLPWLDLRAGAMFAFAQVPVVDPIGTFLHADGVEIADDRVNFNGGAAGTYWGTELDFGATLHPVRGFALDLEAAYLMPGDALQDDNGDAVDSLLGTVRLTYATDI